MGAAKPFAPRPSGAPGAPGAAAWRAGARLALAAAAGGALGGCPPPLERPSAPEYATDLNGVAWPDFCYQEREAEEHFFVIGDWGGIFRGPGVDPIPAYDAKRPFVEGVDDRAQLLVAEQVKIRANASLPRYILNVGDNFYWGGVNTECGAAANSVAASSTAQWQSVYEDIYDGPSLAGLPWLGVLGNHDYGGYMFTKGWDQAIAYTWGTSDRWLTPAQYWSTKVHYSDFTVDYLFVDSNVNDAFAPKDEPGHNMCSERNNPPEASCAETGPSSVTDCTGWFQRLWQTQLVWMDERLNASTGDWRIVVTHFPPQFHQEDWSAIAERHGVDLIVTGHRHQQEVSGRDPKIGGAAWLVSGGGGGITSEGSPSLDGQDDQYGFFDVTISRMEIKLEAISHSGILRSTTIVRTTRPPPPTTTTATSTGTSTTTTSPDKSPKESPGQGSPGEIPRRWVIGGACGRGNIWLPTLLALLVALLSPP